MTFKRFLRVGGGWVFVEKYINANIFSLNIDTSEISYLNHSDNSLLQFPTPDEYIVCCNCCLLHLFFLKYILKKRLRKIVLFLLSTLHHVIIAADVTVGSRDATIGIYENILRNENIKETLKLIGVFYSYII